MTIVTAENAFRRGLDLLTQGDPASAANHFQNAIILEREHGRARLQMRYTYLSYYGLSLALAHGATQHAIEACEVASRRDPHNAVLSLNLSRVYLLAGKTTKALAAVEHGLRSNPDSERLRLEHSRLDRREAPPLSVVPREHPFNKWLGKLRHSMRARVTRSKRPAVEQP